MLEWRIVIRKLIAFLKKMEKWDIEKTIFSNKEFPNKIYKRDLCKAERR